MSGEKKGVELVDVFVFVLFCLVFRVLGVIVFLGGGGDAQRRGESV